MKNTGCGYDSCPCRGIHFIVRGFIDSDYCIDGKRVRVRHGDPVVAFATPEQAERLGIWFLDQYARYIKWHVEQNRKHPAWLMQLQPFDHQYPLRAKETTP